MKTASNAIAVAMNTKPSGYGVRNGLSQAVPSHLIGIAMAAKDASTVKMTENLRRLFSSQVPARPAVDSINDDCDQSLIR